MKDALQIDSGDHAFTSLPSGSDVQRVSGDSQNHTNEAQVSAAKASKDAVQLLSERMDEWERQASSTGDAVSAAQRLAQEEQHKRHTADIDNSIKEFERRNNDARDTISNSSRQSISSSASSRRTWSKYFGMQCRYSLAATPVVRKLYLAGALQRL